MSTLCHCVVLALCLTVTTDLIFAQGYCRINQLTRENPLYWPHLSFTDFPTSHSFQIYEDGVLSCKVFGHPIPKIHWMKDDAIISQNSNPHDDEFPVYVQNDESSKLEGGDTFSLLYLDCVNVSDAGIYTCVAVTRNLIATQVHNVTVGQHPVVCPICRKDNLGDRPARIYMWTTQRLEFQHVVTQLYCRADGTPTPTISWLDRYGRPIVSGQNYTITSVGDLFIRNPTSYNFGAYTCRAVNRAGSDSQWMFFYPL